MILGTCSWPSLYESSGSIDHSSLSLRAGSFSQGPVASRQRRVSTHTRACRHGSSPPSKSRTCERRVGISAVTERNRPNVAFEYGLLSWAPWVTQSRFPAFPRTVWRPFNSEGVMSCSTGPSRSRKLTTVARAVNSTSWMSSSVSRGMTLSYRWRTVSSTSSTRWQVSSSRPPSE